MAKPKEPIELDHIRHEPGHVLAPGLFQSLQKGDYKIKKLDIAYEFGIGERIEFKAAEPLGVPELKVLQGLIAMAGPAGLILEPEPATEEGTQLRLLLETKFDAALENAMVVKSSYRKLAKTIAKGNIDNAKDIKKSIERLWGVSVIVRKNGQHKGFRLLSEYASDDAEGRLYVALNPRIASAILGESKYCRISLDEVIELVSDSSVLVHQRLCGYIDSNSSHKVGIDTLCEYVWPTVANPAAMRQRRRRIREVALKELQTIGWRVVEYAKGKYQIFRP